MNRTLVLAEWKRATESLGAAVSCSRDGFFSDSVSRCYYAILHTAKAVLQTQGISAASHADVKRLFGLHVVQTKLVEPEWGTYIGESSESRLMADYDVEIELSESEAQEECHRSRAFLRRIRKILIGREITEEERKTELWDS